MTHPALQPLPKGWFHHGEQILALLAQHRPCVVVELGTHLGASAIAMARVMEPWGGVVYCVDTWYGVPKPGKRWPIKIFQCATNLVIADVSARIRLIPATTLAAARAWTGPPIDVLYVDADHSTQGCLADLQAWAPHVRSDGLLVGDDYDHVKHPGVREAWETFAQQRGLTLERGEPHNTNPPGMRLVWAVWP